jgi:hypothetical protein
MNNGFWLGLILGIPLAIVANIITRPVQNYLDSRIRSRALRRAREERRYTEEAKRYRKHPEDFYAFLLYSLGWIANWTMILIVGMSALLVVVLIDPQDIRVSQSERLVGLVFCVLIVIDSIRSIQQHAFRAVRMAHIVHWVSDRESLEKAVSESESEDKG